MKRAREPSTTLKPKLQRVGKMKIEARKVIRDSDEIITRLSKDLKLKLVSFLTRFEKLSLARCSRCLKREFTSDEMWKAFIRRISPSPFTLPMTPVTNFNKFRLFYGKPFPKKLPKPIWQKVQLHYVMEIGGTRYAATLINPTIWKDENDIAIRWTGIYS